MPVKLEDPKMNKTITIYTPEREAGAPFQAPTMILTATYEDITPQMYHWYNSNVCELCTKVESSQSMQILEDSGPEYKLLHMRVKIPVVSNRSLI